MLKERKKVNKSNGNGKMHKVLLAIKSQKLTNSKSSIPTLIIENVIKSTGKREPFSWEKIEKSVILAGTDTKGYTKAQANKILQKIYLTLSRETKKAITTTQIRNIVEPIMAEEGYFETARYYILFKERKETLKRKRFKIWEPEMEENAEKTLVTRCSRQDKDGTFLETPGEIFWRVARHMGKAEINWGDEKEADKVSQLFFERMANFKFVCTRSALYEAGNEACLGQLSPCFVLPIEDAIAAIFKTLGDAALIQKNYGGTGFNFSKIRFKGDKVRNVPNAASGPVDFLQVYSASLSKIVQGGKRHGGNMGILNADHPDIYEFISVKDEDGVMKNFNISVGVSNEFMEAVVAGKSYSLRNPRDKRVVKTVSAKKLFDDICEHAHKTGDPGMIFLDRMEEDNFTPSLGRLDATNPCGEQPLLPYESCNLSSVNLAQHLVREKGKWEINWDDLAETVKMGVRFLDNMIEVNSYVLSDTERIVKYGNRKIGLGMIGFAEVLFKLGLGYNSQEGVRIAEKIAKFVKQKAEEASLDLAQARGVFPNWDISTYRGSAEKYRNCTMITIAPTGTVSMIAHTTSGIEPSFALVYTRRSFYNEDSKNSSTASLYYIDPTFEKVLKEEGLYSEELIKKVADNHGSLIGLKEIPAKLKKVFVTTHDIDPKWHVAIQAAFQKYADNSVSKTINFRNTATVEDVKKAYLLAWRLGCKGITIYRDGSKDDQVLTVGIKTEKSKKIDILETPKSAMMNEGNEEQCPECGGTTFQEAGCITCRDCGWSKCKL